MTESENKTAGSVTPPRIATPAGPSSVAARLATPWRVYLLATLVVGTFSVILFVFNPAAHSFYPYCGFHRLTGLQCPGCGALRATHQLLHGHVASAFAYNPLYVGLLPLLLLWLARKAWRKVQGKPTEFTVPTPWIWVALGVMVVFTVFRNL